MKLKRWIAVSLVAGLWSEVANADESMLHATFEVRYKEGLAALKAGQCEQARISFLQLLSLDPDNAKVLLNLAIAEHCTEHYVEGLEHLKAYWASPMADLTTGSREEKQQLYDELWLATGHLRIFADQGTGVVLDGRVKLGNAPLGEVVDVTPGNHHLGAGARSENVTVAAGETKEVDLASPVVAPPAEQKKENSWTSQHVTGVALGGAAVVAAGLGVGFLVAHNGHVTDGKSAALNQEVCRDLTSASCTGYKNSVDSAKHAKTGEIVSFVAAGALAVGAVVLLVPWQKKEGARVSARLVPTSQGVLLDGAF